MSRKRKSDVYDLKPLKKPRIVKIQRERIPKISTLSDLVDVCKKARDGVYFINVNNKKLKAIYEGVKKLNELKGLEDIKTSILEQIIYNLQNLGSKDEYMHTVIMGESGTGKTTLAEIMAEIYCHLGVSATGNIEKVKRVDLISEHIGGTAVLTMDAIERSFGGVLLIDEAYSLGGSSSTIDIFSRECINTLNQCMSEYKKDFICIVVGYEDALKDCFFSINKGLERRFPWRYDTGTTTPKMLEDVFKHQLNLKGWKIDDGAIPANFFSSHISEFGSGGGSTELLVTKCKIAHARRIFGKRGRKIISRDDFLEGFKTFTKNKITPKDNSDIIHSMYL